MEALNEETVWQLTRLCRIDCTQEERQKLLQDLKKILSYFEKLQEIDTENVPPCNCVLKELVNVMREDEVGGLMDRKDFLANAPSHVGGMIKVPPVIKTHP